MKIQQWQLRKVTEPRTLADVPSSRESPVLCWDVDNSVILVMWIYDGVVQRIDGDGLVTICRNQNANDYKLYAQPSRPTRLEDVPDGRVIAATWEDDNAKPDTRYLFRDHEIWFDLKGVDNYTPRMASYWKLTDCVVELVETEIGVVG